MGRGRLLRSSSLFVVVISRTIAWQALFDIASYASRLTPGFSFQPELSASKYYFCGIRKKKMRKKSMPPKTNKLKTAPAPAKGKKKAKHKPLRFSNPIQPVVDLFRNRLFQQISGLTLIVVSVFLGISFVSYLSTWQADDHLFNYSFWEILNNQSLYAANTMGKIGAALANIFIKESFGVSAFFILVFAIAAGIRLIWPKAKIPLWKIFRISVLGLLWFSAAFAFVAPTMMDGILAGRLGVYTHKWLDSLLGTVGAGLLLFFVMILFLLVAGFFKIFKTKKSSFSLFGNKKKDNTKANGKKEPRGDQYNVEEYAIGREDDDEKLLEGYPRPKQKPALTDYPATVELKVDKKPAREPDRKLPPPDIDFTIENPAEQSATPSPPAPSPAPASKPQKGSLETDYDPRLDLPHYKFPPLDLLSDYGATRVNVQNEELQANKNRIVETLSQYKIEIEKIKATIGPTVTLYEIVPAPGIRVSKIKNLEDDIALSLSALGIRIIAPIPGKGTIGIEVPNQNPDIVSMKSVLGSERFQSAHYELPFGMGKTVSNEVFVADLTRMPHILMAGATGQGKSVGLNAIIASLLYKKHPAELKFVMVDPKKVELTLFSKIERHFLAKLPDSEEAIITDTRKVVRTLNSLGIEMDTRYELLKDAQVRNIKEYNVKFLQRRLNPIEGHHFMPYIVLVIDEFADLIMTAGKEIEIPLTRLAQLARAVGIHLIIATQRPSVNIITGSIKANFPARLAFRVISKIDSRTILDSPGADQLIGRGDMLLSTGSDLIRLQCGFIDTPEIDRLTEYIGSQRAYPSAFILPEFADEQSENIAEFDPDQKDPLFEDAARILVQTQQGSTSLLQRKMKIGYNRAGRIIDQLEAAGVVGPFEGSKAREVIIKTEIDLEQFLTDLDTRN
jgi:S-DNA-T family DNA segregation ATPase FtsK/SpoIIIE